MKLIPTTFSLCCLAYPLIAEKPPDVHISEFSAANDRVWCSQLGLDPDWIEIHNSGEDAVNLSGWMLTDQPNNNDRRWPFPDHQAVRIEAGGYLLVYASNEDSVLEDPLELHTNFRLCKYGGVVALLRPDGVIHDAMSFPAQDEHRDHSFVRVDIDRIDLSDQPTPGLPNGTGPVASNCVSPWVSEHRQKDLDCVP